MPNNPSSQNNQSGQTKQSGQQDKVGNNIRKDEPTAKQGSGQDNKSGLNDQSSGKRAGGGM